MAGRTPVRRWGRRHLRAILLAVAGLAPLGAQPALGATGQITGTVTNASGDPLENVCVTPYTLSNTPLGLSADATDSQGDYALSGLATGSYKVRFHPCAHPSLGYVEEWFDNKPTFATAGAVAVTDGQTTSARDAQLALGGQITGTVTDEADQPVEGISVAALTGLSSSDRRFPSLNATDANGEYTIYGVPAGTIKVGFTDSGVDRPAFMDEWYDGIVDPTLSRFAEATPVSVTAGQTTETIDADLTEGGYISGTVTDIETDLPIEGICVFFYEEGSSEENASSVYTGPTGEYLISKLTAGDYRLGFEDCQKTPYMEQRYGSEYWSDKPTLAAADEITVALGEEESGNDAELLFDDDPPVARITSAPTGTTSTTFGLISFASEPGARHQCSVDDAAFTLCGSPQVYGPLGPGPHRFRVKAIDEASNESATVEANWTVDPDATTNTTQGEAQPGDVVSTNPGTGGPTPAVPMITSVQTPTGGTVTVAQSANATTPPPSGYSLLGREVEITAPDATVAHPLRLTFTLDASAIPAGTTPGTVTVFRDGAPAGECPGSSVASPDPCITSRQTIAGGDLVITALSSHASTWNLAAPPPLVSPVTPLSPTPPEKKCKKGQKLKKGKCVKGKKKKKR
jgi:hypothetical protein